MADRVHPAAAEEAAAPPSTTSNPNQEDPNPQPGEYVIQVPKDQVYRLPPPENAHRFKLYTSRATSRRRSSCRRCLCYSLATILLLLLALAATAGILYLVFHPKLPSYSLTHLSISGFNSSSTATLSPIISATVQASNPNKKIAIRYLNGGTATISYSDVDLAEGAWPAFYHAKRNVTTFAMKLAGSGIKLSRAAANTLSTQQRSSSVPLGLDVRVPVKVKFGAVTSWKINVRVRCEVTVDKLVENSKILSERCRAKVKL